MTTDPTISDPDSYAARLAIPLLFQLTGGSSALLCALATEFDTHAAATPDDDPAARLFKPACLTVAGWLREAASAEALLSVSPSHAGAN